ncbi:MAG: hypothetical protein KAI97_06430, partial [Gemmatimonadetes bacterium]|nr:hypothetical protein [Gemmatimonadota bacterium]
MMIKVNTQVADQATDAQRQALEAAGVGSNGSGAADEFDTSSFTVPDRHLDPRGNVNVGVGKRLAKTFDWGVTKVASVLFRGIQLFNQYRPNPSFTPKWSDKPLLKSWEKSKPKLGWPRETDSLCPKCVVEARQRIIDGKEDYTVLINEKVGEIKAQVVERDGQIWMVKECPDHGRFEDLMAIDSEFLEWIESNFPGRDLRTHNDGDLHDHGSSTIK